MIAFVFLVALATAAPASETQPKASQAPAKVTQAPVKPTTSKPQYPVPVCDDGYSRYEGICYKFFSGKALTWQEAEDFCISKRAHLPTVLSKWEAMDLVAIAAQKAPLALENQPWIGYYFNMTQHFSDGSSFFRGIDLAGGLKQEDGLCGKLIVSKTVGGEGQVRQVAQVKCDTTSTSFFCKRRNCPKATSEEIPFGGCKCKDGFYDIMLKLTPEENYKQKYQRGEYCLKIEKTL